jgi:hypothetical protein
MHAKSPWWPRLVALLTVHAALLVPTGAAGPPSETAPATVLPQATVQRDPCQRPRRRRRKPRRPSSGQPDARAGAPGCSGT